MVWVFVCCSSPESIQLDSNFIFFGGNLELAMFLRKTRDVIQNLSFD